MRVLLLGATGNLGSRLIPALLAHGHTVVVLVRNPSKLESLLLASLVHQLQAIISGDATDPTAIASALRDHECDALVNTAGKHSKSWINPTHGVIAAAAAKAAIDVGRERGGRPLRVWMICGLDQLEYPHPKRLHGAGMDSNTSSSNPGDKCKIEDLLPAGVTSHHRGIYDVVTAIPTSELEWTLLCVATMRPKSDQIHDFHNVPSGNRLVLAAGTPPKWQDSWVRQIPVVGKSLHLVAAIASYTTWLEDVADLIAGKLAGDDGGEWVGKVVGMKDVEGRWSVVGLLCSIVMALMA